MRVALLAYGSRGDVQPLLALGSRLRCTGHTVYLAAPANVAQLALAHGMTFIPFPGNPSQLMAAVTAQTRSPLRRVVTMARHFAPLAAALVRAARTTVHDADLVVHSLWTTAPGCLLAHERGIPDICVSLFPLLTPTAAFPAIGFPPLPLGAGYRKLTHAVLHRLYWGGTRLLFDRARRDAPDIPPWGAKLDLCAERSSPVLHAFSPTVVPRPADWDERNHVTGYWFLREPPGWQPPGPLAAFLEAGPPPVVIGFGSMVLPPALLRTIRATLARLEQRFVLLTAETCEWERLPPHVFTIRDVPHDWLFARAAAAVSHGGAGTTAAALRAGIPTVTVPFIADQTFWGRRVAALGAGPRPLPAAQLHPDQLASAIHTAASTSVYRKRAAEVGAAIRAETGLDHAVAVLEQSIT
jgi:sterol 3beta-glucosyltransferase